MFSREMFKWDVQLQRDDGEVHAERVEAYWSPNHETTSDGVAGTARVQAIVRNRRTGGRNDFMPIAVTPIAA